MVKTGDIDLDFADRSQALALIQHVPASRWHQGQLVPHHTGIHVTAVHTDAVTGVAGLDYELAAELGYIKLDLLNNSVYQLVQSPAHLQQLLQQTPPWHRLQQQSFVQQLVHLGRHWHTLQQLPAAVTCHQHLACVLALIRPGKRHLLGRHWHQLEPEIWQPSDTGYSFRKSHAAAYATLVGIHMLLLDHS